ncbi:hypothetical protein HAX54_014039 [Datura stramonium]|uniref:GH3 middle domain-containing protein n=1 Tax=Datura stramonium TaxID=4076 RepID=A0ABS8TPB9_DATST|nr:hypothetical protein [Datura stramonium]
MAFFEFLPVAREDEGPEKSNSYDKNDLVDLVDVKLGHEYELVDCIVIVFDILKVAGFKKQGAPISFHCRKNVALSIDSDKTYEVELHDAVLKASTHLLPFEASLTEYTSYADTSTSTRTHVLCTGN